MNMFQKMFDEHREGVLYIVFGAFTVLVSLLSFKLFVYMEINTFWGNILSWICAVLFAFIVNKWFVFSSKSTEKTVLAREFTSFIGARIFTGLIAIALFPLLCQTALGGEFMGTWDFLAKIVTSMVEIVLNYLFSKYAVFVKRNDDE